LSVGTQLSTKAPVCGGDFPPHVIGQSTITTSENGKWGLNGRKNITQT